MPPFQTQFVNNQNNPLQLLSTIGQLSQGQQDIELRKQNLAFEKEQAQISNAIEAQKANTAAQTFNMELLKLGMGLADPLQPPEIQSIGQELTATAFGGEFAIPKDSINSARADLMQFNDLLKSQGPNSEQALAYKAQMVARYPGRPKILDAIGSLEQIAYDVSLAGGDFSRESQIAFANQLTSSIKDDTVSQAGALMKLTMMRANAIANGQPVDEAIVAAEVAIRKKLNIDKERLTDTELREKQQLTEQSTREVKRYNDSTQAITLIDKALNTEDIRFFHDSLAQQQAIVENSPLLQARIKMREVIKEENLPAFDRETASLLRSRTQRVQDERQAFFGSRLNDYRHFREGVLSPMRGQLLETKRQLESEGKDTTFVDRQLSTVEAQDTILKHMLELGKADMSAFAIPEVGQSTGPFLPSNETAHVQAIQAAEAVMNENRDAFRGFQQEAAGTLTALQAQNQALNDAVRLRADAVETAALAQSQAETALKTQQAARVPSEIELNQAQAEKARAEAGQDTTTLYEAPITTEDGKPARAKIQRDSTSPTGFSVTKVQTDDGIKPLIAETRATAEINLNEPENPGDAARLAALITANDEIGQVEKILFDADGEIDRGILFQSIAKLPFSKGREMDQIIEDAVESKLRLESGAAVNQDEIRRIAKRFKPSTLDSDEAIIGKLVRLRRFVQSALNLADPTGTKQERARSQPTIGLLQRFEQIKQANPDMSKNDIFKQLEREGFKRSGS